MKFRGKRRIKLHLNDGTDRVLVVSEIRISEGIATFGRDDGRGWCELISAPLDSISNWDYM